MKDNKGARQGCEELGNSIRHRGNNSVDKELAAREFELLEVKVSFLLHILREGEISM